MSTPPSNHRLDGAISRSKRLHDQARTLRDLSQTLCAEVREGRDRMMDFQTTLLREKRGSVVSRSPIDLADGR
jgi:hypothetical protein